MSSNGISQTFSNFFGGEKVKCESNEVSMDDPAFAKLDPHLRYEEFDKPLEDEPMTPFTRKSIRKPPGFDMLLNPVKSITKKVEHIKGFRFEVGGAPSPKFQMLHQWNITDVPEGQGRMGPMAMMQGGGGPGGPKQLGTYSLNASYIGGNLMEMDPTKLPPFILTGRLDSTGKLETAVIKHFDERTQLRLSAMFFDADHPMVHADLEYDGDDYTHSFKYGTNMWGFNFMQTIGKNLALGFDFTNASDAKRSGMGGALKYSLRKHSFYAQYQGIQDQLTFAYLQRVNRNVQLVSELSVKPTGEAKTILGYRQRFNTTEVIATINSKGKISSIINLNSGFFNLKLCAQADYNKDNYKFGYGLSLGQTG